MRKLGVFILVLVLLPFVNADVISLNSGGSEVIVLNPDAYVDGFFTCVPATCSGLGYECGSWDDECGEVVNCGTCASGYSCSVGACIADSVSPPSSGGGGGGGGSSTPSTGIEINLESINLDIIRNTNERQIISVTNKGTSATTVSISQEGLDDLVLIEETSLTLNAGETKEFEVVFIGLEDTGIYTGNLVVGSIKIPVSLNVRTKLLLFDSNIVVLNRNYKVSPESELRTRVTLIPMGDPARLDVTLNYVIKDYSGKLYLSQSETLLVEKKKNFRKNFDIGDLPLGRYVVGLELIYPGGVAPSSAHFEIVETTASDFLGTIVLVLLLFILVVAIAIIVLIIWRKKKQGQMQ